MTGREWLYRGLGLRGEIKELKEAYNNALSAAVYTSPQFDTAKVQKTAANSTEIKNIKVVTADENLSQKRKNSIAEKEKILDEIETAIKTIDDTYIRQILTARYVNSKPVAKIAEEMNYDITYIYRLKAEGELSIEIYLKNELLLK